MGFSLQCVSCGSPGLLVQGHGVKNGIFWGHVYKFNVNIDNTLCNKSNFSTKKRIYSEGFFPEMYYLLYTVKKG